MTRPLALAALVLCAAGIVAQSPASDAASQATAAAHPTFDAFDVATIRPANSDAKAGRYIIMQGTHRFVEKYYTLKLLIAAAYDLNPRTISGGPGWVESDHFDILAITPGEVRPTHEEQMTMLRNLLSDRFKLTFHREQKIFSIYQLELASIGPKIKPSTAPPDDPPALISTVYPQRIVLPARNATMRDLTSLLQRAVLDRPVVNKTGLSGRYDFDLTWAPDETQFGGDVPVASSDAPSPPLFTAMQEQLGLRLEATRGPVDALVIDTAERPTAN
jgi:uncharacterized protein (TIGR03435 family)